MGVQQDLATTKDSLRREFPGWHFWEGLAGLKYGRTVKASPPRVVRAPTWAGLRAQLAPPEDAVRGSGRATADPAAPSQDEGETS